MSSTYKRRSAQKSRMTRTQAVASLFSRAVIYAKAGDPMKAGRALVKAAEVSEDIVDDISEDIVEKYDETPEISSNRRRAKSRAMSRAAAEDDIEIMEEGEDDEYLEEEDVLSSFGDAGDDAEPDVDGEGAPLELEEAAFDTAPAVRNVEVPASVAACAKRLSSTRY